MSLPQRLKPIFWDVDFGKLDTKKDKDYIITRIAEKGRWKDVQWMKDQFDLEEIQELVLSSKNTSAKTKSFWQVIG